VLINDVGNVISGGRCACDALGIPCDTSSDGGCLIAVGRHLVVCALWWCVGGIRLSVLGSRRLCLFCRLVGSVLGPYVVECELPFIGGLGWLLSGNLGGFGLFMGGNFPGGSCYFSG
jgi:hypothetical protein